MHKLRPSRPLAPQHCSVILKERLERALVPEVERDEPVGAFDVMPDCNFPVSLFTII